VWMPPKPLAITTAVRTGWARAPDVT
jgi:hypothetical protein